MQAQYFILLLPEMFRKNDHPKVNKQACLLMHAVRLFVLLGFFFAFGQPSALAAPENLCCHLSEDLFNNSDNPFHLPFESVPIPNEPETPGENEMEFNPDDDWSPLSWKHSSEHICNISTSIRSHFSQTLQSFQNRSTVPLFILFLSWKSFLL